jgi:alkylation response protein AidB-like acyl-CoA dehydrogenase
LGHERTSYAHVAGKRRQLDAIKALAQDGHWGGSAADLVAFQRKIAAVDAKLSSLEFTTLRALAPLAAGQAPSDESSILKIMATELAQEITELGLELVGPYGAIEIRDRREPSWRDGLEMTPAYAVPMTADYFFTRAQSIYGGTNEIQRNIIYRMIAG